MRVLPALLVALVILASCATGKEAQKAALTVSADSLAQRQIQMRRFDTTDEAAMLLASAGLLQDLGFTIEESSAKAGLVVASKDRDAVEAGQVTSQVILAGLIAALGGTPNPVWDRNQKIRVSLATRLSGDKSAMIVRVTFQRVVWNTQGHVSRIETINAPSIYQEFFNRLSQAVFLEAHEI